MRRNRHQMAREPLADQIGHVLQPPGLLEQVRGAGDDLDAVGHPKPLGCVRVQTDDRLVGTAHDEQRR